MREKLRILIKHDDQHENVIKLIFLYRNQDPMQRKEYVKMHDDVIEAGGDVKIFSSMHVSGERKSHFYCVQFTIIYFYFDRTVATNGHCSFITISYARTRRGF